MTFTRDHLVVDGRTVAVDVTTLAKRGTGHGKEAAPRLRFDKVVIRVNERLQAALSDRVPDGLMVLLSLTAPIRLAAKTAALIDARVQTLLERGFLERIDTSTIQGNRVQIQIVKHRLKRAPTLIAFVHNPETDPRLLFEMTRELLDLVRATARRGRTTRGLVVMTARRSTCLEAYRHIYSVLGSAASAKKILMVFADERAELLTT